jgi:S-DNA-T family DNA segregation ATPase FtsK/SpoIIIE
MIRAGASAAPPIEKLSERVTLEELPAQVEKLPVIGLASDTLGPLAFEPRGSFLVSGPPASGRTTTLLALAQALRRWNPAVRLYYFGNKKSPLAALEFWTSRACGAEAVEEQAARLSTELPLLPSDGPPVAVFVESVSDYLGASAETALQGLAKVCSSEDWFFVVEGETSTLSSSYGLLGDAKSSRAGLALQPDPGDGTTVFRTNFPPRLNRADFPPGRALLVARGKTTLVQVGLPDGL